VYSGSGYGLGKLKLPAIVVAGVGVVLLKLFCRGGRLWGTGRCWGVGCFWKQVCSGSVVGSGECGVLWEWVGSGKCGWCWGVGGVLSEGWVVEWYIKPLERERHSET
jgi:hypothetical protein